MEAPRDPSSGGTVRAAPGPKAMPGPDATAQALARARDALLAEQHADGEWCFPLEADCTIPAEYVLMMHYMDEVDTRLQEELAVYLRNHQAEHGGWPLYHGGDLDVSCSVKCYWALKLAGDDPAADHMTRARAAILARGGAARSNVFTRVTLALFGQVPWRAVPTIPVELVLLPRWFPFHLSKVSYWTRAVTVPLSILCSTKARAKNPTGEGVRELFTVPPEEEKHYFPVRSRLNRVFLLLERTVRRLEWLVPGALRRRALRAAERWIVARLNGVDGLGAIFPALVNAYEALHALGYPPEHPLRLQAREALRRLIRREEAWSWCQPCFSPVWDTALVCLALEETRATAASAPEVDQALERALRWLEERQILDGPADWRASHPDLAPGGWAFQYANPYYPDLDDTSVAAWAMARKDPGRYHEPLRRAADWLAGMQSRNGGFAAYDSDNTHFWLNEIPFADHGALLDPPTADVSARCLTLFDVLARPEDARTRGACLRYLLSEQEPCGAWFGRWGTNYVYGTWSVLCALELETGDEARAAVRRAVEWLKSVQRADGSWGESNDTYLDPELAGRGPAGTVVHTSWAVLALLAAGEGDSPEVRRGIEFLLAAQEPGGLWDEPWHNAPGFPRVFYLRYHGYSRTFPLWALARHQRHLRRRRR